MTEHRPGFRPPSAAERPHLLVVTADEGLKQFFVEGLVYGGFWISVIASGVQTLEVFRLRSFDLVLLDAALGGLGALETVRRLRDRTDVPILLIAADPAEVAAEDATAAGADAVLAAPLDLEEMVPHLHAIVQRWRAAHPGRPTADQMAQRRPEDG